MAESKLLEHDGGRAERIRLDELTDPSDRLLTMYLFYSLLFLIKYAQRSGRSEVVV